MSEVQGEKAVELVVVMNRLVDRMDRMERARMPVSSAEISVNAGGAGLWAAVTACLVMLALSIVLAVFVATGMADLNRQTQELRQADATMQAYINAGLVQPQETQE